MSNNNQLRSGERQPELVSLRVVWEDKSGRDKYAVVRSLDISPLGMRIEMPEALQARSILSLQSHQLGLHGSGSVRYSTAAGRGKYVTGIEFIGGLRYKMPDKPANGPGDLSKPQTELGPA
ncbi:MAG: hypothetical protein M3Z32_06635 [Acidobacteriota bacterium]|nr:hypothetical protein [Acidobacteriota bacterium]